MKKRILFFALLFTFLFTGSVAISQTTVKAAGEDAGIFYFKNVASGYTLTWSEDTNSVYQSAYTGDWDQQWEFRYDGKGYYTISPVGNYISALVVDGGFVNGASFKCGTNTGEDTQKWSISNVGGGAYVIRSKYDPNYVIEMADTSGGTVARLWRYIQGDNLQKWYRLDNNFLRKSLNTIQNCASLKYLTASGDSLIEQSYSGSSSQKWQFTYSGGYYHIGFSASPYSNAPIYVSSYGANWVVCQLTDGKVKICSRVNPQYVITRKVASNGAVSIVMEKYSGLSSQHWILTGY